MSSRNNRRSERIATDLKVRWIRRSQVVELAAIDMNQHGMFLACEEQVNTGQLLQIEVLVPGEPLTMFVVVRFVGETHSGKGMGVELYLMDDKYRAQWAAFYRSELAAFRRRAATAAAAARSA